MIIKQKCATDQNIYGNSGVCSNVLNKDNWESYKTISVDILKKIRLAVIGQISIDNSDKDFYIEELEFINNIITDNEDAKNI